MGSGQGTDALKNIGMVIEKRPNHREYAV